MSPSALLHLHCSNCNFLVQRTYAPASPGPLAPRPSLSRHSSPQRTRCLSGPCCSCVGRIRGSLPAPPAAATRWDAGAVAAAAAPLGNTRVSMPGGTKPASHSSQVCTPSLHAAEHHPLWLSSNLLHPVAISMLSGSQSAPAVLSSCPPPAAQGAHADPAQPPTCPYLLPDNP